MALSFAFIIYAIKPNNLQSRKMVRDRLMLISINLLVVYHESVNLIGYITRRLSADSPQL